MQFIRNCWENYHPLILILLGITLFLMGPAVIQHAFSETAGQVSSFIGAVIFFVGLGRIYS